MSITRSFHCSCDIEFSLKVTHIQSRVGQLLYTKHCTYPAWRGLYEWTLLEPPNNNDLHFVLQSAESVMKSFVGSPLQSLMGEWFTQRVSILYRWCSWNLNYLPNGIYTVWVRHRAMKTEPNYSLYYVSFIQLQCFSFSWKVEYIARVIQLCQKVLPVVLHIVSWYLTVCNTLLSPSIMCVCIRYDLSDAARVL